MKQKKTIELPLMEPLYSTYHNQGVASAVLVDHPSIRNWYLNQSCILTCTKKFLNGFTTPQINIADSSWLSNPYFSKKILEMQFLRGHVNSVIKNLLDEGYYVIFSGIDDYYIKGKSWYHKRHFNHDGCICGYDQENKTYCLYAYDQNWIYQKFWITQKSFEAGRRSQFKQGVYGSIFGIKPFNVQVSFSYTWALKKIAEYLDSNMEKYPETSEGDVEGIVVHDYIAKYIGKLYDESIPYERMDSRIFRLIWEHKKVMLQRIQLIEQQLSFDDEISSKYEIVVREADNVRMLYAAHHMKRRDSVLPIIQQKLLSFKELEQELLENLLLKSKGRDMK